MNQELPLNKDKAKPSLPAPPKNIADLMMFPMPEVDFDLIGQLFNEKIGIMEIEPSIEVNKAPVQSLPTIEEYDPHEPHSYEQLVIKRKRKNETEELNKIEDDSKFTRRQKKASVHKSYDNPISDNSLFSSFDPKIVNMLKMDGWNPDKGLGLKENGIMKPIVPFGSSLNEGNSNNTVTEPFLEDEETSNIRITESDIEREYISL